MKEVSVAVTITVEVPESYDEGRARRNVRSAIASVLAGQTIGMGTWDGGEVLSISLADEH